MSENNKVSRDMRTRELQERPKQWRPPELLPEPNKEAGFTYRWIRVSMLGKLDQKNITSAFREGWEAVAREEQPKYALLADPESRFKDNIEISGLLLCKIPTELMEQRAAYYADQTRANAEAVDNSLMRQSDSRMPIFKEGKSSISRGTKS